MHRAAPERIAGDDQDLGGGDGELHPGDVGLRPALCLSRRGPLLECAERRDRPGPAEQGEDKFLRGLCYYDAGSRNFYTKDRPIRTPDDLKGLKIRVHEQQDRHGHGQGHGRRADPDRLGRTLFRPGAGHGGRRGEQSAQLHLQQALRGLQALLARRAHPHPRHAADERQGWKKLDPQVQGWVQQAADESAEFQRELWRKDTIAALEQAKAEGVTVYEVDTSLFAAKVQPMLEGIENPEVRICSNKCRGEVKCDRSLPKCKKGHDEGA